MARYDWIAAMDLDTFAHYEQAVNGQALTWAEFEARQAAIAAEFGPGSECPICAGILALGREWAANEGGTSCAA